MLSNEEEGKRLRVFIEPGGCSGFSMECRSIFPKETDHQGEFGKVGLCGLTRTVPIT